MMPAEVVTALWSRFEARDWSGVRELLADDLVVHYPASDEHFIGGDTFRTINETYPEGWHIEVQAVRAEGDDVLALVRLPYDDGHVDWCTERATVRDGRIVELVDLWTTEGGDEAPAWRAPFWSTPPRTATSSPTQEP